MWLTGIYGSPYNEIGTISKQSIDRCLQNISLPRRDTPFVGEYGLLITNRQFPGLTMIMHNFSELGLELKLLMLSAYTYP